MPRIRTRCMVCSLLLSVMVFGHVAQAQITKAPGVPKVDAGPGQPVPKGVTQIMKEGAMLNCADPAATRIDIKLESRSSPTEGDFRIEGIVRNIGRLRYAPASQSNIYLYEISSSGRRRVAGSILATWF